MSSERFRLVALALGVVLAGLGLYFLRYDVQECDTFPSDGRTVPACFVLDRGTGRVELREVDVRPRPAAPAAVEP